MNWIVFSYSLPAQANTPRVTLWRRLRRAGALSLTGSVYILPAQSDCIEAFQWLAKEIRQAGGESLVMHVPQFEGLDDGELVALFNAARQEEYEEVAAQRDALEHQIATSDKTTNTLDFQNSLTKLQKQYAEVARVDYFHCPYGTAVAAQLNQISQLLAFEPNHEPQIARAVIAQYQNRCWVTRPRPHVDRLACAWFIRRYLDPNATIRYALTPESDEAAFDMDDAEFSHQGNLCTFEVMIRTFELDELALNQMAEVVHEIDLRDGRYQRPETSGIDATLRGWLLTNMPDSELEAHGIALFDGLFAALSQATNI